MCKLRSLPAWDNKKVKPESAVVQRAKVETDDTEYLNVIADARLKLEKDLVPAISCTTRGQRQESALFSLSSFWESGVEGPRSF